MRLSKPGNDFVSTSDPIGSLSPFALPESRWKQTIELRLSFHAKPDLAYLGQEQLSFSLFNRSNEYQRLQTMCLIVHLIFVTFIE